MLLLELQEGIPPEETTGLLPYNAWDKHLMCKIYILEFTTHSYIMHVLHAEFPLNIPV